MPAELCGPKEEKRALWSYGFYRQLNDGRLEFISFCDPESAHWLAMYDRDFQELLDKWVPK